MDEKTTHRHRSRRAALTAGLCLAVASVAPVATLAAAAKRGVTVTPSVGSTGTTFTIGFLTPAAAPARAYHVHGQVANAAAKGNSCTTTFDFRNPKKEAAGQHVKFAFRVTADESLCAGRWTVTVKGAGHVVRPSAHFTLQ